MRDLPDFSQALAELIEARIWAGLHYRTADVQGEPLGRNVAELRGRELLPASRKLTIRKAAQS